MIDDYSISELADELGISIARLEWWRREGILVPTHRTGGRHSRYTEDDLLRALEVIRLRNLGWSYARIRATFHVRNSSAARE